MKNIFSKKTSSQLGRNSEPQQPANDPQWLKRCFLQNEAPLIRYTKHLVRNMEIAQEIVQDSFLKLWQQKQSELEGRETPWLFTTCRNSGYDWLRKKKHTVSTDAEVSLEVADTSLNADEIMLLHDDTARLHYLINKLSDQQREILLMKFESNMSYKEISEITGLSISHIGVLIHNVVTKLRENMGRVGVK